MFLKLTVVVCALCIGASSQESDLRVQVNVNLVQVDAVVTDSHGKHVTSLTKDDFELLLDGEAQTLKTFDFVEGAAKPRHREISEGHLSSTVPITISAAIKAADVRRTIVVFVDDLSLSADRVSYVRKALNNLVDKQMRPGDLVAIARASAGLGALTDFTTDKNLLRTAADQVQWIASGKGKMKAYDVDTDLAALGAQETRLRAEYFATATVESLRRLVEGMVSLPGRKSVIILSNSLPLALPEYDNGLALNTANPIANLEPLGSLGEKMLRLSDAATRASVVFYAIDTRLLATPVELSSDATPKVGLVVNTQSVSPAGYGLSQSSPAGSFPVVADPQLGKSDYRVQRGGGMFLAAQTGGFMLYDLNDISHAIEQVLEDSNGYYLLGFERPEEVFQQGDLFPRIRIRLRDRLSISAHALASMANRTPPEWCRTLPAVN